MKYRTAELAKIDIARLNAFQRILIVDSSCWEIAANLKNLFAGCRSDACCKLQLCYEYLKGEISFFDVTAEKVTDSKYAATIPQLIRAKDLFIADLGYFKLATLKQIVTAGADFISRFFVGTGLYDAVTKKQIDIYALLKNSTLSIFELPVIIGTIASEQLPCRLICIRVPEHVANQRRRKMNQKAHARNRPSHALHQFCAGWTIMVTSVSKDILPTETIRPIYGIRWQIELLFKQFKSVIKVNQTTTGKPQRFLCELLGKLIAIVLVHKWHATLNTASWNNNKIEVSFDKLHKRFQERAYTFHCYLLESVKKMLDFMQHELEHWKNGILKQRQKSRMSTLETVTKLLETR